MHTLPTRHTSPRARRRGARPLAVLLALLTALAGLVSVAAPAQAAAEATFVSKFGSLGTGPGQLQYPWDVAVAPSGDVYVADTSNRRVQQFTGDGEFVRSITHDSFNSIYGLDVDAAGNVYVAASYPAAVVKFTSGGTHVATYPLANDGYAFDVAVASDGSMFVADPGRNVVVKLDSAGQQVTQWGGNGSGNGQFSGAYGVAVDPQGLVLVADYSNARVQKFTANGEYVSSITQVGDRALGHPYKVDTNTHGQVVVGEFSRHSVVVFSSDGGVDATWGSYGLGDNQFTYPMGVAITDDGVVYVGDYNNSQVKKFSLGPVFDAFTPTITGSGRAGDELTVSAQTTPEPASWTYAWTVDGSDEVRSDSTTFTPGLGDVGKNVKVTVTAHGVDGEPKDRVATATKAIAPKLMDATATLVDSTPDTAPSTGDVLSVKVDESTLPEGATGTVRWGRVADEECTVTGDPAAEYTVVDGDAGATLCARVTYSATGHETFTKTVTADATARGTFTVPSPTVDLESLTVGEAVTASVDLADAPEGAEVTGWQWGVVDGEACTEIDGADERTLTPDASEFDKTLCVTVTVSAPHHLDATSTLTVGKVGAGAFGQSPTVTIPDWVQVGIESSVTVTGGDPADADRKYQWNLNGEPIEGATNATYTPKASDEGDELSVTVTSSSTGYVDDATTSATVEVATGDFAVPEPLLSTDRPAVGVPVSLPIDLTDAPEGAASHWQWGVVEGEECVAVDGATADTFTPAADQLGEVLCVEAGVTAPGYGSIGGTLVIENPVVRGTLPAIRPVLSTTSPKVGAKLTTSLFSSELPAGAKTTVAWGYSPANTTCRPTTASASLAVSSKMVGRTVCALVTVTAPGYAEFTTVLKTGLVKETALMTVTPKKIKGTAKFTVRAQGLAPHQRFQIVTAGKDVRGKADSYGRIVRTIKYGKGLKSKTRLVGLRGYDAKGKTTFAKKVKVTYRAR